MRQVYPERGRRVGALTAQGPHERLRPSTIADTGGRILQGLSHADALLKGAEAECKALKEEFKRRGLLTVAGEQFTVTRSEQISGRLDVSAVKQYLGESWRRFEVATVSTVIRIKAVQRLATAA